MTKFEFGLEWLASEVKETEHRHTMAMLELCVGNTCLTRNEDIWSQSVRDRVHVSAYPLAMWLASSWWRLMWEPLPAQGRRPTLDWRMAHELGAANHGYVWPQIMFASDSDAIQIWAVPSNANRGQSVNYLNGLNVHAAVPIKQFSKSVEGFISTVISRLEALGCGDTELSELWKLVKEELEDPVAVKYRRLEAEMGFDPDECPDYIMSQALELDRRMGTDTLSELAPVYGKNEAGASISSISDIVEAPGLWGVPEIPRIRVSGHSAHIPPWQRAVKDAAALRASLGNKFGLLDNSNLCGLLGIREIDVEQWEPSGRGGSAIAVPDDGKKLKFLPRKKHRVAKRFETARFVGDFILAGQSSKKWLASTDLGTYRQKYQRAFAAELLCPIEGLVSFLEGDFSETAVEDAAQYFDVSTSTVNALLANNGLVSSTLSLGYGEAAFPY